MEHELIFLNVLIENCVFRNIDGRNNKGRPGGELISVKASGNQLISSSAINCRCRFSFRHGRSNTAHDIRIDESPGQQYSGFQVYGYNHTITGMTMDRDASLYLGDGDANSIGEQRPGKNHWPATHFQGTRIRGGTIRFLRRYKRYRPKGVMLYDNTSRIRNDWS